MLTTESPSTAPSQPEQLNPLTQFAADTSDGFSPYWAKVMIVDDEPINIELAKIYLQEDGYTTIFSTADSREAIGMIRAERPDVILLDLMMPHVSGFDVLRAVRQDPQLRHIPVIILTASNSTEARFRALELGVNEFLSKPVDSSELLLRLRNTLAAKALCDHLASYSARLEREVQKRTIQLEASRLEALLCLARAAEFRDDDTGEHVMRVGRYVGIIAAGLGFEPRIVELLEQAAQLHDIGKIGIPDAILLKPGPLTKEEFDAMKEHCLFGRSIIRPMTDEEWQMASKRAPWGHLVKGIPSSPIMKLAASIAVSHHERWDGTGYPHGLQGKGIPVEGRITAVADVFDAVSSVRPYKKAMPWEKCLSIIQEGRGSHFDPNVVDVFMRQLDHVRAVFNENQHSQAAKPTAQPMIAPVPTETPAPVSS